MGGRPYVRRNVEALDYDVTLSESPTTPSARATALLALLEIVGKMPAILPAVVDVILDLADIPDKPKILRRIRAIMVQQGINIEGGDGATAAGAGASPTQVQNPPGLQPVVQPPGMPTAPTASAVPPTIPRPRAGRPSSPMRRTLAAQTGGAPLGAGV